MGKELLLLHLHLMHDWKKDSAVYQVKLHVSNISSVFQHLMLLFLFLTQNSDSEKGIERSSFKEIPQNREVLKKQNVNFPHETKDAVLKSWHWFVKSLHDISGLIFYHLSPQLNAVVVESPQHTDSVLPLLFDLQVKEDFDHRIIEWLEVEWSSRIIKFQPPATGRVANC